MLRKLKLSSSVLSAIVLGSLVVSGASCKKSVPTSETSGAAATNTAAPAGDTIKIGEVGSMTGSEATFGTSTHNGIDLAVRAINAAGGIQGKKLQVISLDDQGKP